MTKYVLTIIIDYCSSILQSEAGDFETTTPSHSSEEQQRKLLSSDTIIRVNEIITPPDIQHQM